MVELQLLQRGESYAALLESLPEHELYHDRGSRLPIDYTYEVVLINRRIAARVGGVTPPELPPMPIVAPEFFRERQLAADEVRESTKAIVEAWDESGDGGALDLVPPTDEPTTRLELALIALWHLGYHEGQLSVVAQQSGSSTADR
ncbi:MAG: hypothetical protein C4321_10970 [Chloroflexota bacterium]